MLLRPRSLARPQSRRGAGPEDADPQCGEGGRGTAVPAAAQPLLGVQGARGAGTPSFCPFAGRTREGEEEEEGRRGCGSAVQTGSRPGMRRSGRLCKHPPPCACARPVRTGDPAPARASPGAQLGRRALPGTGHRPSGRAAGPSDRAATPRGCGGGGPDQGPRPGRRSIPPAPEARAPGRRARPRIPPGPAPPGRPPAAAHLARPRRRSRSAARPAAARRPAPARARGGAASLGRPALGGDAGRRSGRGAGLGRRGARQPRREPGAAEEPPPGRWAARSGRERLPSSGSASLEAAAPTKMAAALSLGSDLVPDWGRGRAGM